MDRLAYQNMTSKGRANQYNVPDDYTNTKYTQNFTNEAPNNNNHQKNNNSTYQDTTLQNNNSTYQDTPLQNCYEFNGGHGDASLNNFSQPTGELTSKSKMNTQINHYCLEKQSKNYGQYNNYVSALHNNIREDQHRTNINNDRLLTEQREMDNFQRIYHPGLSNQSNDQGHSLMEFDRNGVCTRDRRENAKARNKNTVHIQPSEDVPHPHPKLNYPQGYDQLTPMNMDMSSQIEFQFLGLTDLDMEQQIQNLQSKPSKQNKQPIHGQMPSDRQTIFQAQNQPSYNPHADYLNHQLHQMSQQMPENKNSINNQLNNMNSMYNLNSLPEIPTADSLSFIRPIPSNNQNRSAVNFNLQHPQSLITSKPINN